MTKLYTPQQVTEAMSALHPDWVVRDEGRAIERQFSFPDFHRTMAFANALAWLAHQLDHHPQLLLDYNYCQVRLRTHRLGGLTGLDFDMAAFRDLIAGLNPEARIFQVSCKTSEGIDEWASWLAEMCSAE